jgi:hypothetical protein
MTIKARDFDFMVNKLGFDTRDGRDLLAWLEIDGKKVVRTRRSHMKGGDLPFQHSIRQQMKLSEQEQSRVLGCQIGRAEYIELLKGKGVV